MHGEGQLCKSRINKYIKIVETVTKFKDSCFSMTTNWLELQELQYYKFVFFKRLQQMNLMSDRNLSWKLFLFPHSPLT